MLKYQLNGFAPCPECGQFTSVYSALDKYGINMTKKMCLSCLAMWVLHFREKRMKELELQREKIDKEYEEYKNWDVSDVKQAYEKTRKFL